MPFSAGKVFTVPVRPAPLERSMLNLTQHLRGISSKTAYLRTFSSSRLHSAQAVTEFVEIPETPALRPVLLSLSLPLVRKASDSAPDDHCVALDPTVFNHPVRRDILHLCVVHYLDSLRQGSANTKTRGEVRGSGIKIRRQKGSGRARLGDGQSPMLVGGGVAFGPKPRDFSTKLPRKVIQMGMRVALSTKLKEQRLGIMQSLYWPNMKTKHLAQRVDNLGCRKTLFVTGEEELPKDLERAMRNIPAVDIVTSKDLNVYTILKWPRLVMDLKAVEYFEQTLGKRQIAS